jgi:hypothetical protein
LLKIFGEHAEPADRLIVRVVMHGDKNLARADIDTCGTGLLYWPIAETQASALLLGHVDLSFFWIRGSQAAQNAVLF